LSQARRVEVVSAQQLQVLVVNEERPYGARNQILPGDDEVACNKSQDVISMTTWPDKLDVVQVGKVHNRQAFLVAEKEEVAKFVVAIV
jgi:hypothetical protein